ncbi:CLUMA_CG016688, isoform A [Clunio marinus]|uniref:CLUMA_CG016688, isoform A n=1 Tax=Clunio marinus TaxID=568069 RepID=A0A1J1IST3_9DIPT|nr:CLUMA_CG016688, isoform A [Clunio marinus]
MYKQTQMHTKSHKPSKEMNMINDNKMTKRSLMEVANCDTFLRKLFVLFLQCSEENSEQGANWLFPLKLIERKVEKSWGLRRTFLLTFEIAFDFDN